HDLLHDGETEAGAAFLAGGDEGLKEAVFDLGWDPRSGVCDRDHQLLPGLLASASLGTVDGIFPRGDGQGSPTWPHCLHGVARKIVDGAGDSSFVEARD